MWRCGRSRTDGKPMGKIKKVCINYDVGPIRWQVTIIPHIWVENIPRMWAFYRHMICYFNHLMENLSNDRLTIRIGLMVFGSGVCQSRRHFQSYTIQHCQPASTGTARERSISIQSHQVVSHRKRYRFVNGVVIKKERKKEPICLRNRLKTIYFDKKVKLWDTQTTNDIVWTAGPKNHYSLSLSVRSLFGKGVYCYCYVTYKCCFGSTECQRQ